MGRPKHAAEQKGGAREFMSLVLIAVVAVLAGLAIRAYVVEPFVIPSGSMEDTLLVGDRVVGEKVSYRFSEPKAGDVVTFTDPEDPSQTLIKRVVATAGQTVELVDGAVVVDGVELSEPYVEGRPSEALSGHGSNLDANVSYPYTVPEGYLWVMGDNRTNSLDSRYFGAIPVSSVTSHAMLVFWPLDEIGFI